MAVGYSYGAPARYHRATAVRTRGFSHPSASRADDCDKGDRSTCSHGIGSFNSLFLPAG